MSKPHRPILDTRALYLNCSLADLYDEVTMPVELRRVHQQDDWDVMQAYGFWGTVKTESDCYGKADGEACTTDEVKESSEYDDS